MIESVPPPIEKCTLDPSPTEMVGGEQFTYEEVARLKRVTKQTVMEWVKRGMVPSPIYTGFTARFTQEQVADIMCGCSVPGTYPVTLSPRAQIAKKAREDAAAAAAAAAAAKAKKSKSKPKATTKSKPGDNTSKKPTAGKAKKQKGARS